MQIEDINASDLANLNAQGYTENDLAMLAKSEVDALLAVPADEDSGNIASADDPHAAAAAEQDAANTVVTEDEATAPADGPFIPQYSAEVPADAADQIKALKLEERTAFKQLMDGEIDADAYQEIRDRVETDTDDLKTKALTASIFQQTNEQNAAQNARAEWNKAESSSFATFKAEGLDYRGKPALLAAYNTNLRALGADPKNENRDAAWFLAEAHRVTKEDLGFVAKVAPKPAQVVRNGVDPSQIPPTLRNVPVAATGSVNADEFAHMRNLEGIALEKAHAALSEAQRDRWMAE